MKMDYESRYAAFRAAKMIELFGQPPLLNSESLEVYKKFLAGLGEDFGPKSTVEMMWVRDFADVSWEMFRLRRFKVQVLERKVQELRVMLATREKERAKGVRASSLAHAPENDEPQTKLERVAELDQIANDGADDVDEILANGAEEVEYVMAFEWTLKRIQIIEMMENFKMAARESILRQLEDFKNGWGGHVQRVWGRLEKEYQQTAALTTQSSESRVPEIDDDIAT